MSKAVVVGDDRPEYDGAGGGGHEPIRECGLEPDGGEPVGGGEVLGNPSEADDLVRTGGGGSRGAVDGRQVVAIESGGRPRAAVR